MLFNSFGFICLIPVVLFVYYLALHVCRRGGNTLVNRAGNIVLLVLSYGFFFTHQPAYTLLLFGITAVTYIFGLIFSRLPQDTPHNRRRRWLLVLVAVILVVLPLAIFKYSNFLLDLSRSILSPAGIDIGDAHFSFIVPLGISFFTFQALGYMWDVYYGRFPAEKNFADYMLFVAFFPQIASGPISRASTLLPQIKQTRPLDWSDLTAGIRLLLWGYFLKAVFADRVAIIANPVFDNFEYYSGATCFIGSIMYSLQIYGDFAGYSLMAIGIGRMLGFRLPDNFSRPYFSASVSEFWRRWHISLSAWLRDYVYIPLGGSRKGKSRTYGNLFVTFLVSGIWHGANLTFVFWGLLHGLFQSIEKFFSIAKRPDGKFWLIVRITLTFLLVNFAWIFFRMPSFSDSIHFIGKIFTAAPGLAISPTKSDNLIIVAAILVVFIKELTEELRPSFSLINHRRTWVRVLTLLTLTFAIIMLGVLDSSQFIYVNF